MTFVRKIRAFNVDEIDNWGYSNKRNTITKLFVTSLTEI